MKFVELDKLYLPHYATRFSTIVPVCCKTGMLSQLIKGLLCVCTRMGMCVCCVCTCVCAGVCMDACVVCACMHVCATVRVSVCVHLYIVCEADIGTNKTVDVKWNTCIEISLLDIECCTNITTLQIM